MNETLVSDLLNLFPDFTFACTSTCSEGNLYYHFQYLGSSILTLHVDEIPTFIDIASGNRAPYPKGPTYGYYQSVIDDHCRYNKD